MRLRCLRSTAKGDADSIAKIGLLATQKSGLFKMIENNYKFISVVKGKEG